MQHIEWTSELDTGIRVIDNQHRQIVGYINKLIDIRATQDGKQIAPVLKDLVNYTQSHFTFEEALMDKAGYPFIKAHKRIHQLFVKKVGRYVQRFKRGEDISDELLETLKAWLVNHIKHDDGDYAAMIKGNLEGGDSAEKSGWIARKVKEIFG